MGHLGAIREPDDRNVLGLDPTFAGKKAQRGVCIRDANPGDPCRAVPVVTRAAKLS
jgi:hypothetical protein